MSGHKWYQVIAECAHVVTSTTGVRSQVLLYKGAFLPDDVEPERLKFLLDGGFVAAEGDTPVAPNAAVEQDPRRGVDSVTADGLRGDKPDTDSGSASDVSATVAEVAVAEGRIDKATDSDGVAEKRAAARAKLPADGSMPKSSHGQDVWVEYLVAQGSNYDDLAGQDKQALIELAKSRQQ
ncbi:hypothetical protein AB0B63_06885 [Micromonospora sp. NPDC049081]|uniref:hypothetical protein n=1 Tax=Micromonospora sp. NPDC049081 TaxID=3155150 RepID=UPI003403E00C